MAKVDAVIVHIIKFCMRTSALIVC